MDEMESKRFSVSGKIHLKIDKPEEKRILLDMK